MGGEVSVSKDKEFGEIDEFVFASSSIQGRRLAQEDTYVNHINTYCIFDNLIFILHFKM